MNEMKTMVKFWLFVFFNLLMIMWLIFQTRRKNTVHQLPTMRAEAFVANPRGKLPQSNTSTPDVSLTPDFPPITLFVRLSSGLKARYYCDLFRSTVLYWPPSYGKTVMVLDQEAEQDHAFGDTILKQTKEHFPDYKLEVFYEPLPKDKSTLDFPGAPRSPSYNRQLWSSFLIDLYTNDSIVGWMDSDTSFILPVTNVSIFKGEKIRILGSACTLHFSWVQEWKKTTELALGRPFILDGMTYFPVFIYRDTFTHFREFVMKRFNTSDFDEAFRKIYKGWISPSTVILNYAWHFERERYDWNLQVCTDINEFNKGLPVNAHLRPEDITNVLPEPQSAYHVRYTPILYKNMLLSYCLTLEAAGHKPDICTKRPMPVSDNLVLFNPDLQRVKSFDQTPCTGNSRNACIEALSRHYKHAGAEIKQMKRKLEWKNVEIVQKLASDASIKCTLFD